MEGLSSSLGVNVSLITEPTLQFVNVTVEVLRNVTENTTTEVKGECAPRPMPLETAKDMA